MNIVYPDDNQSIVLECVGIVLSMMPLPHPPNARPSPQLSLGSEHRPKPLHIDAKTLAAVPKEQRGASQDIEAAAVRLFTTATTTPWPPPTRTARRPSSSRARRDETLEVFCV